jgi:hypothetical protein
MYIYYNLCLSNLYDVFVIKKGTSDYFAHFFELFVNLHFHKNGKNNMLMTCEILNNRTFSHARFEYHQKFGNDLMLAWIC